MKAIIVKPKLESQSRLLMDLLKELKIPARYLADEEAEDAWLAKLIDVGMKEKGEIPLSTIRRKLRK